MIAVKDLDISLSLKLGDPVSGNDDGEQFKQEGRLGYLIRGYARLVRMLYKLMRNNAPLFAKQKKYHTQIITSSVFDLIIDDAIVVIDTVDELFVKVEKKGSLVYKGLATYIQPDGYIAVREGINDHYIPTINGNDSSIFYTKLDNKIYLLPVLNNVETENHYTEISTVFKSDAENFTINDSLAIPNEYVDLLISLAASEGMQDIARTDKVNLYAGDVANQMSILKNYSDTIEAKRGSDLNG